MPFDRNGQNDSKKRKTDLLWKRSFSQRKHEWFVLFSLLATAFLTISTNKSCRYSILVQTCPEFVYNRRVIKYGSRSFATSGYREFSYSIIIDARRRIIFPLINARRPCLGFSKVDMTMSKVLSRFPHNEGGSPCTFLGVADAVTHIVGLVPTQRRRTFLRSSQNWRTMATPAASPALLLNRHSHKNRDHSSEDFIPLSARWWNQGL